MTKVLVIGASRGIGLETVKALLAKNHEVRAFARSTATIPLDNERLEKVDGDALDRRDIDRALEGVDAVIQSLGVSFGPQTVLKGTTLFSTSSRVLVDAMRTKGIKRLIAVTGLGAGDSRGHGGLLYSTLLFPLVLKRVYDDKDIEEQIVRASGLDWTIVRPGLLTSGAARGRYQVLTDPKSWRAGSISRGDVGEFLARQVEERTYIGQTPVLIE
ncbi:MAG: SDR family oxidoreductase [Hyphomicrobium sp.]